ncbi:MAG TPA: glycosyltransferase family 39 protein [Thermoanaerobaculia bacterium]|nr:glycosyltransferase family 39 protein [Thermoanaerobaculia bacterium]
MTSTRRRDAIGAAALAVLGIGLRLGFNAAFPTEPVSDFRGLVMFGLRLRDEGLAVPGWHWVQFNSGLPLFLAGLFRVFPHHVANTARVATAVATGLVPLLPYALWRGVLRWKERFLAGLFLALWPGLVLFSGVVAQENWVMIPTVALAALAVRRLRDPEGRGYPVAAGLLFALAAAVRQEMLLVLAPAVIAAAGVPGKSAGRASRILRLAAAAAIPLLVLAAERRAATGRFAITTEHGGLGVLGTLVPGSAAAGWTDPTLYVASVEPSLLRDSVRMRSAAWTLARDEASRRWRFHAFRSGAAALRLSVESEAQNLFWALEAPGTLPDSKILSAASWARAVRPWLRVELALASGFFFAALVLGVRRRDRAILLLSATVLLRFLALLAFSPLGRLMVPAVALELMTIALAIGELGAPERRGVVGFVGLGLAAAAILLAVEQPLDRLAIRKDEAPPTVRSFPLGIAGAAGQFADCEVTSGRLDAMSGDRVGVGPASDSAFRVDCRLPAHLPDGRLGLDYDANRGQLNVEVDGRQLTDVWAPAESGWHRWEIAETSSGPRAVVLQGGSAAGFGFVVLRPGATPLPRYRALP